MYGTPADRQAVLRLAWYIRLIRFEDSIRTKKNDSQVPTIFTKSGSHYREVIDPCAYFEVYRLLHF